MGVTRPPLRHRVGAAAARSRGHRHCNTLHLARCRTCAYVTDPWGPQATPPGRLPHLGKRLKRAVSANELPCPPRCALRQVGDGWEDFSPTPEEARQLISASYAVPDTLLVQVRSTLEGGRLTAVPCSPTQACLEACCTSNACQRVRRTQACVCRLAGPWGCAPGRMLCVYHAAHPPQSCSTLHPGPLLHRPLSPPSPCKAQFTNDDTDETPVAAAMLSSPGGDPALLARRVATAVLPGSHVTPCGVPPGWRLAPGAPFGPAEAVAMAAQAALQGDTYRLAGRVLSHLDAHS